MKYAYRMAGAAVVAALVILGSGIARSPGARLLWLQGRAVSWNGDGRGVVLLSTGELVAVDGGRRAAPLAVRPGGRTLLEATVDAQGEVWLVDGGGTVLRRHADGTLRETGRTPFDIPTLALAPDGGVWAARSARQFTFRPESPGAAAVVRLDAGLRSDGAAGRVVLPANPFLAQLANAGHLLATRDGGVVFAPFVRDEVVRYDRTGREVWRLARGLRHATPDPRLLIVHTASGTDVQVDYAPVNLGLAMGPDGRAYLLSTPSATTAASRLDALDPSSGRLLRTWNFPTALPTIAVDRRGRLTTPDPESLLPGRDPGRRDSFPDFDVLGLGPRRVRSADFAGKVTLVNFWASWCAPCREEMPALDSLRWSYDSARVALVALSDDVSTSAARAFIAVHGFTFPVGLGGGRLRSRYHYVGLPHTVLLDAEGRVIRQWSGYAGPSQMVSIGALIDAELTRKAAPQHHH